LAEELVETAESNDSRFDLAAAGKGEYWSGDALNDFSGDIFEFDGRRDF